MGTSPNTRTVTVSVPGRVCLAGEDVDWMAGPAILCAIDLRLTASVSPLSKGSDAVLVTSGQPYCLAQSIPLGRYHEYGQDALAFVRAALKVLSSRNLDVQPLHLHISTTLPPSAGLSSSAAVSLASLSALAEFHGYHVSITDLCELAYVLEAEELGTGAGQMDFYSCALGGTIYIDCSVRPPQPIEHFSLSPMVDLVVVDTLTPHRTADVIRTKRARFAASEPTIMEYMGSTQSAISRLRKILASNGHSSTPQADIEELGQIVTLCHGYLRDLMGVSTPLLDKCVEECLRNGAIGAKLTGTGMGGCMFALVPKDATENVVRALRGYPVRVFVTKPATAGVSVTHDAK